MTSARMKRHLGWAVPWLLSGLDVPAAALLTVLATHGVEAVTAHPSLQKLGAGTAAGWA